MNLFWERAALAPANSRFRLTATPFLVESVKGVKPGKALDLGMGSGRNSLYLAGQGWDVTGVDISDKAIRQAREQAQTAGASYTTVAANLDTWDMGTEKWDLIAAIYGPSRQWADRIVDALKPGGLLVGTIYAKDNRTEENAMLKMFLRLRILRYEEKMAISDFNPTNTMVKPSPEQSLLAQKI